jgi:NAD(P)-dependent dehydrogenase (short-subunit alcohol dehydrogenase family)
MRILLVGANGLLGRAVHAALTGPGAGHDVVTASRSSGEHVDLTDPASIAALYERVGTVDAVACAAGVTPFAPLPELRLDQYRAGLTDKLLGQIALVRLGLDHVADGGSFTLVSGILGEDPIATGSVAATVNGGLYAFARAAAIELPRGLRINTVSPTVFAEAWDAYGDYFPGYPPVPVAEAARAFLKSISGHQTGQTYRVGY